MKDISFIVSAVVNKQTGLDVYTFENTEKLVAYMSSRTTNWGILYQTPMEEVLKETVEIKQILSFSFMAVLAISIIAIILASLYINKPIKKVINMIGKVEAGDSSLANYKTQKNELGIIEDEIIEMLKEINNSYGLLEEKVEERTKELTVAMNDLSIAKNELVSANKKLEAISLTDGLTGIPNRRHLDQYFLHTWENFKRKNIKVAILMIDIDNFKQFNDDQGHYEGDQCLKAVASTLKKLLHRESDFFARYGGEEFIVALNNIDEKGALNVAEKLCRGVEALKCPHRTSPIKPFVTISIGVALINNWENITPKKAIVIADNMLYKAKDNGKNRCEITIV